MKAIDIFRQNLLNNTDKIENLLLSVGFNLENITELPPTDSITIRRLHQFWMHKIKKINEDKYLHIGRHPIFGIIFRDIINNLYYVHKDTKSSWYTAI